MGKSTVADKMRVHILAKELNVPSKVIIEKCKAEGITSVKNHMSTLSAGLHATIREWFSEGSHDTTVETSKPVDLAMVRLKKRPRKKPAPATPAAPPAEPAEKPAPAADESPPSEAAPVTDDATSAVAATQPDEGSPASTATAMPPEVAETSAPPQAPPPEVREKAPEAAPASEQPAGAVAEEDQTTAAEPTPVEPAGPQNVPARAKVRGPRVVRYEAPDWDVQGPDQRRPAAERRRTGPLEETPGPRSAEPGVVDREAGRRRGRSVPRRATGRLAEAGERPAGWRDQDLQERRERLAGATGRRILRRRTTSAASVRAQPVPAGPKTEATVHEPVRMKEFCAATGLNFIQCFQVLKEEHAIVANVNMTLPTETAELLALHFGIELKVIPSKTRLDSLQERFAGRTRVNPMARPPVVTLLGHVDHGKTSLLDVIRRTRVAAGEEGGITQHTGAYRVESPHGPVTFLDTPGHEAFTAMRARGAQLTDVVVLVVAADDGVMPQTVEAINHAKAAGVPIVVALNKIDLGEQNKLKIYGQLAEHGVVPGGEWGGDVDVIPTSATTGRGIQELVEHLADLSSLLDFKADPTLPAMGTVIEAETRPGVGAVVHLLVQEGTLHVGDFVVCGPAYGKVRALVDDRGQRVDHAGPSEPVEVWGLDEVSAAGDRLYQVESLQEAKEIAMEIRRARVESARLQSRKATTLEEMFLRRDADEVPELNLIIKADVDGSVAALRQALGDFPSDDVRLTIRHSAVGAVNDSDVLLAAACAGIVAAFRVEVPTAVRRIAEQHGVEIRSYRLIYDVCDEVKKALEGLLAPEERVEPRAVAEVREVFRFGKKVGAVAGCYVTEGVVDRGHVARVMRNGVLVRDGCRFASLRRFKDDVKEVRAGMECGIKLEGFDDVHIGDRIETYEIVKVARTL